MPTRRPLLRPLGGVAAFVAVLLVWHAPAVVDASAHSVGSWDAEIGCYLVGGLLLWAQLVGGGASASGWDPLSRTWLAVAVLVAGSAVGAAMLFASGTWYPAFDGGRHALLAWSLDQAFAGATIGVLPAIPLGAFAWWCYAEWLRRDEDDDLHLAQVLAGAGEVVPVSAAGPLQHASMEDRRG